VWEGSSATAQEAGADIVPDQDGYRAASGERLDLLFSPTSEAVPLRGSATRLGRVFGRVGDRSVDGLGTLTETTRPPEWDELDAVRSVSALFGPDRAVLVLARRPRGVYGHGEELVTGHLVGPGEDGAVEEARLSTTYDGEGRQRTAGLELWVPGQDFPRRAAGTVRAGASIALEGLRVNAAVFSWTMEGREGLGAYDIVVRDEPVAA
jgi:hypothetical protein